MSKHWNPRKATVPLKPSRIRRDPVQLQTVVKAEPVSREREILGGVAGILLVAITLVTAIIGVSAVTLFRDDPNAAAEAMRFGQCYNSGGPNCVVDGETIYVANQRLTIAGMAVPSISAAQCEGERDQGINAAMGLAQLLNSGRVTVGPVFTDQNGRAVRTVTVAGKDVATTMIKEGLAHKPGGDASGWCG